MILLTRLDKQQMFLNPDHLVSIEETPDTVITLYNGNHFIVTERAHVVIARIVAFRAKVIRRTGTAVGKKYLAKPKRSLFANATRNREEMCPQKRDDQFRTPLHTQEI